MIGVRDVTEKLRNRLEPESVWSNVDKRDKGWSLPTFIASDGSYYGNWLASNAEERRARQLAAQKAKEAEERRQREQAAQRAKEAEERRQRELAARRAKEAEDRRQRELAAQRAKEAEERRQRELAAQRARQAENQRNQGPKAKGTMSRERKRKRASRLRWEVRPKRSAPSRLFPQKEETSSMRRQWLALKR